ncbi:DUF5009 domain-containing protein [Parabacteroides sp. PF5-6]|uniref:DUF5009 domain-containing protein n=1 Tax=Parabacteroides sp. PF5-6 TaxID=1742403 RepID=UPI0024050879|nr:DUF5009 domain-containing protein [Parabacteroides sp. PF5-6]MDF9828940.1 heparan-alpha-glucosaminide N-acetyltransferase [Parabacteroides sp. PF5-6]
MRTTTSRIEALDIFRALTMFFMLFVNDIPGLKNIPHWLLHAQRNEDMLGFSDTIFPGFLFAMGMAIPFAIENRIRKGDTLPRIAWHVLSRTIALLIMGLFTVNLESLDPSATGISWILFSSIMVIAFFLVWSVYPKATDGKKYLFTGMKIVGVLLLVYLFSIYEGQDGSAFSPKWWGILGLIGWTYLVCTFIYLFTRNSIVYNSIAWGILILCSVLSASGVFDGWAFVGYIPSEATLHGFGMAGVCASLIMQKYANKQSPKPFMIIMSCIGAVLLVAAIIAHQYWIISKLQGTPTWLFYCCAIFFPLFACIYWLTDVKGKSHWFTIIKPAGTITLTCYIIPYVWSIRAIAGPHHPALLNSGIPGLITSLIYSLIVIALAWLLMKMKIRLKI